MFQGFRHRPVLFVLLGLGLGLLVGVGMMIGTLAAVTGPQNASLTFPPTLLNAVASHSGESMAIATGPVDTDIEGLFVLDYLTGDLQCFVIYPRSAGPNMFGAAFKYNVIQDLGVEQGKKPNFAMVTGGADFQRGAAAAATPIPCAVYVVDANTGNFAAYTITWNRTLARSMGPQTGTFVKIGAGRARNLEIRE